MSRSKVIVIGVLVAAFAFAGVLVVMTRKAGGLPEWVGRQVVGIANAYLVPQVSYRTLRYTPPFEVTLIGVTLTAPDGTKVVTIEELGVKLAELPSVGKPIVIEHLTLVKPEVVVERQAEGGVKGLWPLLRARVKEADGVPSEMKLSNVLKLRRVAITNGSVRYTAWKGSPIALDGITTEMIVAPDSAGQGWYALDVSSGRKPALAATVRGRVNIDTLVAEIATGEATVTLDRQSSTGLPAEIQKLLAEYDAGGVAALSFSGTVPALDPTAGNLTARLKVQDFSLAMGSNRFPLQVLEGEASLAGGVLSIPRLTASPIGGRLEASGSARLNEAGMPMELRWKAEGMDLAQLQRDPKAAQSPATLLGVLATEGTATTRLEDIKGSAGGAGKATVRNGRLLVLPGVQQLMDMMQIAIPESAKTATDHSLDADFELGPGVVRVTRSELQSPLIAARVTGTIGFDQRLDLRANAGPLEKLQSAMGKIGELFGKLTDKLVGYRIRGTVSAPEVSVEGPG